jgi:V-type H+-transporting ATPase subunit F
MESRTRIGVMGDEETLIGFLIAGVESLYGDPNLVQVTEETPEEDLRRLFHALVKRRDIAIVLICDFVAEKLKEEIQEYKDPIPSLLEIPSKARKL